MSHADAGKLEKAGEALSWLKQAELHYKWLQADIADSCIARARAALDDECFRRKPIPGFARNEQPDVVRVIADNPLGYAIVNACDYDETVHRLYVEGSSDKPKTKQTKVT